MTEATIFATALEKQSAAERAAYLDQACAGNGKLRGRVEALLQAHAAPDSQLDAAAGGPGSTDIQPITEKTGTRIGPYRLMEQIGEGGFGVVFVAEQQEPVRRKVALKLIKPGMDSNQVIARFEAERQALAMMDHPNIARVLDAGATDTGRPYFVMELVRGISITEYCDKNQLNPSERMEIFVTVCNAIQHAHQKGIIHRDIKPSNVLVTSHDGKPVAKVIDFGVAKAIHQQLTERTIYTQFAQMIGTPLYMSPEQAEMSGLDIDTRSDIYSLGVLLYELFTGSTPLEKSRLVSAAFDEVRRLIREDEPLRPSQRLSTSATLSSLAANRKTEPARLSHQMKGELDWIVMKALEKDRTRRYETASALAADIGRYLRDEQVEACPPSATYRLRKFIRRNRFVFASGSLVAAILLMGIMVSTWFAVRAHEQQNLAQMARLAAEHERDRAEKAQQTAMVQSQQAEVQRQNAEVARTSEKTHRTAAEQERDKATALSEELAREKQELGRQKEEQRRMLYISDMNLIQAAWAADNVGRVIELLNAHRPYPGQVDLRGFEWHYWNRQCHSDQRTVNVKLGGSVWYASEAFSPDGKRLAWVHSPSGDSFNQPPVLKVMDIETGVEQHVFNLSVDGRSSSVSCAWHPDGTRLAVTIDDRKGAVKLTMCDMTAGKSLFTINEPTSVERFQENLTGKSDLWFSGDGTRLAAAVGKRDGDGPVQPVVKFWDCQTGAELAAIPLPSQRISSVTISADGSRIAFAGHSAATEEVASGETIKILEVASPDNAVTISRAGLASFRFSPDGQRLFVSGTGNLSRSTARESGGGVFDTSTGQRLFSLPDSEPWSTARISPDGQWLAVSSQSRPRSVKLYRTTGDRAPVEFQGHTNRLSTLSFSADSQRLFTIVGNSLIKTWDVSAIRPEPARLASATIESRLLTVVSSDGNQIATAPNATLNANALAPDTRKNVITVRDEAGNVLHQTAELVGPVKWLKFSPDGRRLAACAVTHDGDLLSAAQLCVWDTASGAEQLTLRLPAREVRYSESTSQLRIRRDAPGAAFSPDGRRLAAIHNLASGTAQTSAVKTWEIDSRREVWEGEKVSSLATDLKFSPDGGRIVGVPDYSASARLTVWDAGDGRMLWKARTNIQVSAVGFSTDGQQIFGHVGNLGEILLWDTASGRELQTIRDPELRFGSPTSTIIVLSPNGRWLAAGNRFSTSTIKVWDVNRPERELFALAGHGALIQSITFSPDSRRIATCTSVFLASETGGETKLWDGETGQELLTLPGAARNIVFSANGTGLIAESGDTWSGDIRVRRWDASRLPPPVEAEQMVEAFRVRRGTEPLPLMSEILARIDADQTLPDETRAAAIAIVKSLRRDKELNETAWAIAALPGQPQQKYERALHYLEEVCATDPDNRESWSTLGLVHYRLGQSTEALAALARSKELHAAKKLSRPAEDLTILAMTQHLAGQPVEARATLEQVRTLASHNETAWQKLLAEAESLLGIPKAADEPERWIGRQVMPRRAATVKHEDGSMVHPDLPYTIDRVEGDRLWFGMNSIGRSEVVLLEDADSYYTHDLQAGQDTAGDYQRRGKAWRVLGKFDQAIEDFSAAIRLSPGNFYNYQQRGEVWHHDKHELEKALADFDAALRIMPSSTSLHIARGRVLLDQGQFDVALKSFDDAIGLAPTLGQAYSWRAYVWSAKNDRDKMLQDLEKGIRLSPEDSGVWTMRAWLLATSPNAEHRDGKQAVADGMKACELTDWSDYNCLENLAAAYAETGDFVQAVNWQEKAVTLTPLGKREDFESRLKLYREGKPFRELPKVNPAVEKEVPLAEQDFATATRVRNMRTICLCC